MAETIGLELRIIEKTDEVNIYVTDEMVSQWSSG